MKHLLVPYNIARQLKEKGFDEPCFWFVLNDEIKSFDLSNPHTDKTNSGDHISLFRDAYTLPLYQQVIDWFREKYDIFISQENRSGHLICRVWYKRDFTNSTNHFICNAETPHEALTKAIEAALKLI